MTPDSFQYQDPFPVAKDETRYELLSREGVSEEKLDGQTFLRVSSEALTRLAEKAGTDVQDDPRYRTHLSAIGQSGRVSRKGVAAPSDHFETG